MKELWFQSLMSNAQIIYLIEMKKLIWPIIDRLKSKDDQQNVIKGDSRHWSDHLRNRDEEIVIKNHWQIEDQGLGAERNQGNSRRPDSFFRVKISHTTFVLGVSSS
jgi:hypothetical protein